MFRSSFSVRGISLGRYGALVAIMVVLVTFATSVRAIDYTWGGGVGGWAVPAMWLPPGVPGIGDTATIPAGFVTTAFAPPVFSAAVFVAGTGELEIGAGTVLGTPSLTLSGGTLSGTGAVLGDVTNTNGTVSPTGLGLLTFGGDFTQGPMGNTRIDIGFAGPPGVGYDQISVLGDTNLHGRLTLDVFGGYVPFGADQFSVIDDTDSIDGAWSQIINRVINPSGIGGTVWGDYREDNPGPGADRYFVSPRRNGDFNGVVSVSGADFTIWADKFGQSMATFGNGDANGDRLITGGDFTV